MLFTHMLNDEGIELSVKGVSFHPPQKFKHLPFWNDRSYKIEQCGVNVTFNRITCLPDFMNLLDQKLLVGDTHTDWWFAKPTFIFGK
jgi:hypothetical protein